MSRMRILCNNGFYGLLLMHMQFSLDEECSGVGTDGERIYFSPEFLDSLTDNDLDIVMMHEIMHVALRHCMRSKNHDEECFDKACDIVVNSNILASNNMNKNSITLSKFGELMHTTPDNKEGKDFTAEEVYAILKVRSSSNGKGSEKADGTGKTDGSGKDSGKTDGSGKGSGKTDGSGKGSKKTNGSGIGSGKTDGSGKGSGKADGSGRGSGKSNNGSFSDDHSKWGTSEDETLDELWNQRLLSTAETISIRDPSNSRGTLPAFALRKLKELKEPQTDWRTILNDFVHEEINDYSFSPPDKRFDESPFFLPDFNEKDDKAEKILFMIDTSGSMSDEMITEAYSEVKGAIDQFDGKLSGWLGFFDAAVIKPEPFTDEDEFKIISPIGGGGTSFHIIFKYVFEHMADDLPVSIIILTDGYAPFPEESCAHGIPVLWIINNEDITPPWGKTTRIKSDE